MEKEITFADLQAFHKNIKFKGEVTDLRNDQRITICLTSCGRWDLLEITLKSLVQFWDGAEPEKLLIYEDQDLTDQYKTILHDLVRKAIDDKWLFEIYTGKVGQIKAIDIMYAKVETPYIFHCEDDWTFTKSGFVQKSLSILEENPMISQVWIREPNDRNGHPASGQVQKTSDGVKYQMMKTGFRGVWHGHSFNPGLRRLSDYQKLFPNGMYSEIHWSPSNPLQAEQLVGKKYFKNGYRSCTLLDGYVVHSGQNRHVKG
jgi:hypothetical protein